MSKNPLLLKVKTTYRFNYFRRLKRVIIFLDPISN